MAKGAEANLLRQWRQRRGLSQAELAAQAGVTRQTVSGIENSSYGPTVAVALRLARALNCGLDDLFVSAAPAGRVGATWGGRRPPNPGQLVHLVEVGGRWVAHPVWPAVDTVAADGVVAGSPFTGDPGSDWQTIAAGPTVRVGARPPGARGHRPTVPVELHGPLPLPGTRIAVAGCDPALGLLARRAQTGTNSQILWLPLGSMAALRALAAGLVHAAGLHLHDEASGEYNRPFVQQELAGQDVILQPLFETAAGWLTAPGNPRGIDGPSSLLRPDVKLINRELGTGARLLLEDELRRARLALDKVLGYGHTVPTPLDVARAIVNGFGDCGIASVGAARAFALDFTPLRVERFDLAIPAVYEPIPALADLVNHLSKPSFQRELRLLGGQRLT